MEEDDSRIRSPQRRNSVVSGVNPLMRRGSAVSSSAQKPPPPVPQTAAPPSTPPPPPPIPPTPPTPPTPPVPFQRSGSSSPTKFVPADDDLVRQSVALSFSGVYPDRNSDVDDGYHLPGIPEDEEMDHPLAEKSSTIAGEDSEEEEHQRPQQQFPVQPPPPIPSPPSSPSNTGPSPISIPLVRQASQPVAMQSTPAETQTSPPLSPKANEFVTVPLTPTPALDAAQTAPVEYEKIGLGWKLCPSVAVLWQERFFVLRRDGTIHYYADRTAYVEKYAPKGVINLADLQNDPMSRNGVYDSVELMHDKLNIYVRSKGNRIYKLKFGTAEEAQAWRDAIYKHVKRIYSL